MFFLFSVYFKILFCAMRKADIFLTRNAKKTNFWYVSGIKICLLTLIFLGVSEQNNAGASETEQKLSRYEFHSVQMAVPIQITLYAENEEAASEAAEAAFLRFHDLNARLSDYTAQSELRLFCDHAQKGEFRVVSRDLWNVLHESVRIAKISDGAFDPTVGQVVRLWRRARMHKKLPREAEITKMLRTVGYENILLDEKTRSVALSRQGIERCVRIDLGGIAKGYAIDEAIRTVKTYGITRVLVDAGGDVGVGDPPPGEKGWRLAITPIKEGEKPRGFLVLANCGVANSGDLAQFLEIGGVRYSHLVDPKTGVGLTHRVLVSVIAPSAMEADALASAVSVLGEVKGKNLVESLEGRETQILLPDEQGQVQKVESSGWQKFIDENTCEDSVHKK
ncbi:MAG: FAD:protein FMN transferase [Planctomycetia bacterium]|nr:FAD:protein FMN transferase [Planctomycetia bacterium]